MPGPNTNEEHVFVGDATEEEEDDDGMELYFLQELFSFMEALTNAIERRQWQERHLPTWFAPIGPIMRMVPMLEMPTSLFMREACTIPLNRVHHEHPTAGEPTRADKVALRRAQAARLVEQRRIERRKSATQHVRRNDAQRNGARRNRENFNHRR